MRTLPKLATKMLVPALEHSAHCPRDDRVGHSESRFDLDVVADDAATGSIEQGAFVPPDAVPPTRRGLTKATPVRKSDQCNAVAVDWDEPEQQLPQHRRTHLPLFGIEARTVRRVGHPNERRDLPV